MGDHFIRQRAQEDFNRAKGRASLSRIINLLAPEKQYLLSFQEVKDLLKPRGESYRGLSVVNIKDIVGSEDRYQDFDRMYLPKREHIRGRWERVDQAHLKSVILPPIKLYKIGDAYFVRDGNHRVSVARAQGGEAIDAEVVELDTEIHITPRMTREDLRAAVIEYEKKRFFQDTEIGKILSPEELQFTAIGRYDEVLRHIAGHKYFMNLSKDYEISFLDAARSWYESLYIPIRRIIRDENLLSAFPGRTESDLYIWIITHWHHLKLRYGEEFSLEKAASDYAEKFGNSLQIRLRRLFTVLSESLHRFFSSSKADTDTGPEK